jgi:SulP family sulfate permease
VSDCWTEIYFIESGVITIQIEMRNKESKRLRTIGPGIAIGEMAIYVGQKRSASAIVESDCVLQKISIENIHKMEIEAPQIAIAFNKFIISILVERMTYTNKQLDILRS